MKSLVLLITAVFCFSLIPITVHADDWYFKPSKDNKPAKTEPEFESLLHKYGGIYIGNTNKKIIYLTFDNGYEQGYTAEILDILKKKHVPAAFFITGHYLQDQPELVKRMVKEGHIIGNHSWHHPDMTKISDKRFKEELDSLKKGFTSLTGEKQMNYVRPPRGIFDNRTLRLSKQYGYTSVFWSFAYKDWVVDDQKGADYAYKSIMKRVHPGAIMLLHTVSKDNAEALGKVIDDLRKQGYQFKSLDYLMAHKVIPSEFW